MGKRRKIDIIFIKFDNPILSQAYTLVLVPSTWRALLSPTLVNNFYFQYIINKVFCI